jgi:hypothetical protein
MAAPAAAAIGNGPLLAGTVTAFCNRLRPNPAFPESNTNTTSGQAELRFDRHSNSPHTICWRIARGTFDNSSLTPEDGAGWTFAHFVNHQLSHDGALSVANVPMTPQLQLASHDPHGVLATVATHPPVPVPTPRPPPNLLSPTPVRSSALLAANPTYPVWPRRAFPTAVAPLRADTSPSHCVHRDPAPPNCPTRRPPTCTQSIRQCEAQLQMDQIRLIIERTVAVSDSPPPDSATVPPPSASTRAQQYSVPPPLRTRPA